MNFRDAALQYLRAGLAVLPARLSEKRPALAGWKAYQQRLPSETEVSAWFANSHDAMCIVTGGVSGNLEMLDFDQGGELFDAWAKIVSEDAPGLIEKLCIESTQSGGWHVIYRSDAPVCGNLHLAQRAVEVNSGEQVTIGGKPYKPRRSASGKWEVTLTLIETRGEGGLFLCCPTPGYEMLQGSIDQIATITVQERDVLLEAAWSLNELVPAPVAVPPDPHQGAERPGDAFNGRGDISAVLLKHGWTLARDADNQQWRRPGKTSGCSATLKDRVFYVFSTNAGPFEADKAYGPFAVYTMLEHGGDFTAAASALRSLGYGSAPVSLPDPKLAVPASPELFQPKSVRQLTTRYPALRPPVIHGLLRQGETMNVISAPKVGKSWLVIDLALSIATGRDWLGQFRCERGEVLILDNELHGETSAHRIPRVGDARQLPIDAYADRVYVQNLRGQLQDVFTLNAYFQSLQPGRFRVIILDAFYRFMPRDMDENDNGTMASLYNHIDRYADQLNCSFILIHHTTKGSQSAKAVTDVGAGAGSQSRATDTHLVLRPHEEDDAVVLDAAARSWPPVKPRCLRWNFPVWSPADDLDPEQLREGGSKKRAEKKEEWSPDAFVATFITDEPATRSAILSKAIAAGLSRWSADNLLRTADSDGLLLKTGEGKRTQPCTYQRLKVVAEQAEEAL